MEKEIAKILIEKAKSGKNIEFEFIINRQMKRIVKITLKATNKFVKSIDKELKVSHKKIKDQGFIDCKTFNKIEFFNKLLNYYSKDAEILKDMLKEYRCYYWQNNHLIATWLGMNRLEDELIDWRTLPFSF